MNFDDLEFKTVTPSRPVGSEFITLKKRGYSITLVLNVCAVDTLKELLPDYNAIELLVAGDGVFAIKPKTRPKGKNQSQFTATSLKGKIKNLPLNERIPVALYKDMIVCDLREEQIWNTKQSHKEEQSYTMNH